MLVRQKLKPHVAVLCVAASVILGGCELLAVPQPPARSDEVRAPWVLFEHSGDSLVLGVMKGGDDCSTYTGVDLLESREVVEIHTWVQNFQTDGCFLVRLYERVTVELSAPLGSRTLRGCLIAKSGPHDSRAGCGELVAN